MLSPHPAAQTGPGSGPPNSMPSRRILEVLVEAGYANSWDLDSPDRLATGNRDIREELLRLIVAWECIVDL